MDRIPEAISVIEDEEHFLVIIPPGERERAKRIPGRIWDPKKRAWVYEKSIENYEALEKEFRKDAAEFALRQTGCSLPTEEEPEPTDRDQGSVLLESLGAEISGLGDKLDRLAESAREQHETLSAQFEMMLDWQKTSRKSEELLEEKITLDHYDQLLRYLYMEGLPKECPLTRIFEENHLIKDLPYVVNRLEEALKQQLRKYLGLDNGRQTLHDLIEELNEACSVNRETLGQLRSFKAVRNRSVHEEEKSKSRRLQRSIICILSLILAWPAISTPSEGKSDDG